MTGPAHRIAPEVGDTFVLPDSEYLHGIGPVIARITEVHGPVAYRGGP